MAVLLKQPSPVLISVTKKSGIEPFPYIARISHCSVLEQFQSCEIKLTSPTHLYVNKPVSSPIASNSYQSLWKKENLMWNMVFSVKWS